MRGQEYVEIFDNSFFRDNYELTTLFENIGDAEKKYVDEFFRFQKYPKKIGENHRFYLWTNKKIEENESAVSVIVEHWFKKKKRIDSLACQINLNEYDVDKRYRFLYLSEEKIEKSTKTFAKITPGWWTMKSEFMDWKWFQKQIEIISNKIDEKMNNE